MALALPPARWRDTAEALRLLFDSIRAIADGRSNAFGAFRPDDATTTTTLTDPRIGTDSVIVLMPTNAAAATEIGNGTIYIGTVTAGSATVTHADAEDPRLFKYSIQG